MIIAFLLKLTNKIKTMQKKNKIAVPFIFMIFIIVSFSCSDKQGSKEANHIQIEYDSIAITGDTLCQEAYYNFTINLDDNLLLGFNNRTNSIDMIDLGKEKLIGHIPIEKEGPNGIPGNIEGIYFHNKDSIFAFSSGIIYIIDSKARITKKIELRNYIGHTAAIPVINNYFRIIYLKKTNDLFMQNLYFFPILQDYLDSSIVLRVNIDNIKATKLPIVFSDYFKEKKGRFGFLRWMNFESNKGDSLFFNSQFDDELIIYNNKTNKIEKRELNQLKRTMALNENSEGQDELNQAITSTHRFALIYDKWRNIYYRFVWGGVAIKSTDKFYNGMLDKPLDLEIYDDNFLLMKNIRLENQVYSINTWFVTKDGLYLSPTHPKSNKTEENKIKFDIIKVKKKKKMKE
jgi:hypothetical protein